MDGIDFCQQGFGNRRQRCRQGFLQLIKGGCANDGAADEPARTDKTQGKFGGSEAMFSSEFRIGSNGRSNVGLAVALTESWPLGQAPGGSSVREIFPAQMPESKRRIGQQTNFLVVAGFRHAGLETAVQQTVGILRRDNVGES